MNRELMEQLLLDDENSALDFKRDQYPFKGASDEQKSKLLKDILSFANSWRRTEAYILIGVEEVRGGRSSIIGVTEHLNDADLQQFINAKLNRPVEFSYQAFDIDGIQIGIIRIPLQVRPLYSIKKFGIVNPNEVYIRHGSSNSVATPDEIARMGVVAHEEKVIPTATTYFWNPNKNSAIGTNIELVSTVLKLPPLEQIPRFKVDNFLGGDSKYYVKYAQYLAQSLIFQPVYLSITNTGNTVLTNPVLKIHIPKAEGLFLSDEYDLPSPPSTGRVISRVSIPNIPTPTDINIYSEGNTWFIEANCLRIPPKGTYHFEAFYIGSRVSILLKQEAVLYADNLPNPLSTILTWQIESDQRDISVKQIMTMIEAHTEERFKEYIDEDDE